MCRFEKLNSLEQKFHDFFFFKSRIKSFGHLSSECSTAQKTLEKRIPDRHNWVRRGRGEFHGEFCDAGDEQGAD